MGSAHCAKPPPITAIDININHLLNDFNVLKLEKEDFEFTLNQAGIRIFAKDNDKYNLIKNYMVESKIKFYTHALRENQEIRFVQYGLPDMELGEVKKLLTENNNIAGVFLE